MAGVVASAFAVFARTPASRDQGHEHVLAEGNAEIIKGKQHCFFHIERRTAAFYSDA